MLRKLAHNVRSLLGGNRGNRGESLAEVLVSMAIGALALLMLAMAISVATHIASTSRTTMDDYYKASSAIATGTSGTSLGTGTISLADSASGLALVSSGESLRVQYHKYAEGNSSSVIVFEESS